MAMATSSPRFPSIAIPCFCFLLLLLALASLQLHPSTVFLYPSFQGQGKEQEVNGTIDVQNQNQSKSEEMDADGTILETDDGKIVLQELLEKAAMADKTVIFTGVNAAWAEPGSLLDVFLESFRLINSTDNLLKHLIILAFDQKAYNRCIQLHPYCYQLRTQGVDFMGAKAYMSTDYVTMMWRRIQFLNIILEEGYSFIFSDADILWLRNPFPHLLPHEDFQISCDQFNGNAKSIQNSPNGGYTFARSNERTIKFYKFWYESHITYPMKHDQDVFIEIRKENQIQEIGVKVGYLDNKHFVSFCSHWTFDMHVVDTIHANCCNGLANKVRNLRTLLNDWKVFRTNVTKQDQKWKGPDGCTFDWI